MCENVHFVVFFLSALFSGIRQPYLRVVGLEVDEESTGRNITSQFTPRKCYYLSLLHVSVTISVYST